MAAATMCDTTYLVDRSQGLAKSIKEVEAEILRGQGACGRSDASLRAHGQVKQLRKALGGTLGPLLAEAESQGLGSELEGVRGEMAKSEASVAFAL